MSKPRQFKFIDMYLRRRPNHYDLIVYEDELQNDYDVSGKCADAITHKPNCYWHIIESKGTDIDKAIMQFENTLDKLSGKKVGGKDFRIELFILIAKKITNSNKWKKSRRGHFLKDPNIRDPENSKKKIKGVYIKLIYHSEIFGKKRFPENFDLVEVN